MALILRACVSIPTRRCFNELSFFARSIGCVKHDGGVFKRHVRNFQIKRFSSTAASEGEEPPTLVYLGMLRKQMRYIKLFSLTSSVTMLVCQPILMAKIAETDSALLLGSTLLVSAFFIVISPLLLHMITRKYVIRMYHYPDTNIYTLVTYNLFALEKKLKFNSRQVVLPTIDGPFTSCYVRGQPMFFDQTNFLVPEHYIKIMNFDKPVDLKLKNNKDKQSEEIIEEKEEEYRRSENKG